MKNYTAPLIHMSNRGGNRVSIWRDCYASSLEYVDHLTQLLLQDFPRADRSRFEVKIYDGPRYKRMLALEYDLPDGEEAPAKYERSDLPPTM